MASAFNKYKVESETQMYVSVFHGFVCVHIRKIGSDGSYGIGIAMSPNEWNTFTKLTSYASTKFGRIALTKQKTAIMLARTENTPNKGKREITITAKGMIALKSSMASINEDIVKARTIAQVDDRGATQEDITEVAVVLALKMYAKLRKEMCTACNEQHEQPAQMMHACLDEDEETIRERVERSVTGTQNTVVAAVFACKDICVRASYIYTVMASRKDEIKEKVRMNTYSPDASTIVDNFYANILFMFA